MPSKNKFISLKSVNKYEKNPFITELEGRMFIRPKANTIIARGERLVSTETGEVLKDDILLGRRRYVDKSQFAKIYCTEIGILYELSKTATNVFFYLTKVMNYDNEAYLNYNQDCQKLGYKTHLPCLRGLQELIENDLIALSHKIHHYWLNPLVVCKGERFTKYYEYIVGKENEPSKILKKQFKKNLEKLPNKVKDKVDKAAEVLPEDMTVEKKKISKTPKKRRRPSKK